MTDRVSERGEWLSVTMVAVASDGRRVVHSVTLTNALFSETPPDFPADVEHPLWKKGMRILGEAVLKDMNEGRA